jgi:hypothetical protein
MTTKTDRFSGLVLVAEKGCFLTQGSDNLN